MAFISTNQYPIMVSADNSTYYALPVATELKASWETLDSSSTGRDNNSGAMFRDKVTDKIKWEISLPKGMESGTRVATETWGTSHSVNTIYGLAKLITDILSKSDFYIKAPNPMTGTCTAKNVYCSSCEPDIEKITAWDSNGLPTAWIYKAISIHCIEM